MWKVTLRNWNIVHRIFTIPYIYIYTYIIFTWKEKMDSEKFRNFIRGMILLLINNNPFQLNIYLLVKKERERKLWSQRNLKINFINVKTLRNRITWEEKMDSEKVRNFIHGIILLLFNNNPFQLNIYLWKKKRERERVMIAKKFKNKFHKCEKPSKSNFYDSLYIHIYYIYLGTKINSKKVRNFIRGIILLINNPFQLNIYSWKILKKLGIK